VRVARRVREARGNARGERGARGVRRIQMSERGEMVRWAKRVHVTIKEAMRVRASDEGESSERSKRRDRGFGLGGQ
jgi:hypothetical protein